MPIHDWARVPAGIFHAFHHGWIEEISRALNAGILPPEYYSLPVQHAAGFGPDVLTLQVAGQGAADEDLPPQASHGGPSLLVSPPKVAMTAETEMEFYRRKQSTVAVRRTSGDEIVAVVEVVSPGSKAARHALRAFVQKAAELLDRGA